MAPSPTDNQDGTDNNSQNLNIWTPGVNDGKKRPVMVWLHGGGFSTGSANEEGYDGENLSRSGDVVVVSVNHRLNVFGQISVAIWICLPMGRNIRIPSMWESGISWPPWNGFRIT